MKKSRKKSFPIITVVLVFFAVIFYIVSNSQQAYSPDDKVNKEVTHTSSSSTIVIHYLDVGQGDSEFIELPDGKTMLIDASTSDYASKIVESIEQYGYDSIDCLVATHPDSDHIGGMSEVVNSFDIGEIYMPKVSKTTKTFENLLTTISDSNLSINTAFAGKTIYSTSEYKVELLAPNSDTYEDVNDYSAVIMVSFGSRSFLFTGDAGEISEEEMLSANSYDLSADVLKVAHHGSHSATSVDFLNAVNPSYAIISCGEDNSYGHPHKETLSKLSSIGAEVYRTDIEGTITITSNGYDIEVETEK